MRDLSIIILSYNTKDITRRTIDSLLETLKKTKLSYEVIVVDNNSTDGSQDMLLTYPRQIIRLLFLHKNVGFGKGNNKALALAKGKYILYLNSDVIHENVNYDTLISYMDTHTDIGALTVKVVLTNGQIDPASHRGFPTIWRSFTYYAKLEKLFGKVTGVNKLFGGYHLTYLDVQKTHEVEAITGAYFLTRKSLMEQLKGFDEDFFMYGEDLDLAYRVKEAGYKVLYYPRYTVTHLKYQSGIKTENTTIRKEIKRHFYQSMMIFYKKHYEKDNNPLVNKVVYSIIRFMGSISG